MVLATVLASDDEGGEGSNFLVVASVSSDTYYIEVRGLRVFGHRRLYASCGWRFLGFGGRVAFGK